VRLSVPPWLLCSPLSTVARRLLPSLSPSFALVRPLFLKAEHPRKLSHFQDVVKHFFTHFVTQCTPSPALLQLPCPTRPSEQPKTKQTHRAYVPTKSCFFFAPVYYCLPGLQTRSLNYATPAAPRCRQKNPASCLQTLIVLFSWPASRFLNSISSPTSSAMYCLPCIQAPLLEQNPIAP
jgi:hypothetical protein